MFEILDSLVNKHLYIIVKSCDYFSYNSSGVYGYIYVRMWNI